MGVHLRQAFDIVSYRVATPGVLGAMVVLGVAGIATRGGGLADYLSLAGGLAILVPLACWFVLIPGGRAHRADIERLLAGEGWAHWRYDEADWPWAVAARERGQRHHRHLARRGSDRRRTRAARAGRAGGRRTGRLRPARRPGLRRLRA